MFNQFKKENIMNKFFKTLSFLAVIALLISACGQVVQAAGSADDYQAVLGKSLTNREVANFITSNKCSSDGPFQVCKNTGIALWLDPNQTVRSVYLYPTGTDSFVAYKGTLPLGLAANDTMATIERKFGQPQIAQAPQAGWESGLPDEGASPDHVHYWAIYKRFGVTIVYNSPLPDDQNATIYALLVHE
jgi:hypothetical protein